MKLIGQQTEAIKQFISRWHDSTDYIEAFTSGSTGKPKKITLLKSDMEASAKATCDYFHINSDSVLHLPLSADYIAGKMMIVRALVSNSTLWAESPTISPLREILSPQITLSAIVPSQLPGLLANIEAHHYTGLKNLIIGGAPISAENESQLANYQFKSFATYGMTETCSHVALRECGSKVYQALPNINFDGDTRQCLIINLPNRSEKKVVTNDIVELISPTSFIWKGRFDNVINSGGIKVYPEEIEAILAPYIRQNFYITSRPSDIWGEEVVAMIEGEKNKIEIPENLLGKAQKPKDIIFVNQFPRTSSGKIIRNKPQMC